MFNNSSNCLGAFVQRIASIMSQFSSPTSFLITWRLDYSHTSLSNETFTIYYGIGNADTLSGTTQELSYNLTGLTSNQNYTVLIELTYAFSTQTSSKQTYHFLEYTTTTQATQQNLTAIVIVIAVIITFLLVLGILVILLIFLIWVNMGKAPSHSFIKSNLPGEEPANIGEVIDAAIRNSQFANTNLDEH